MNSELAELGTKFRQNVLKEVNDSAIVVVSATVARPSLDDVYLRYAGRTFEVAA